MVLGSRIRDPGSGKNLFRIPFPGVKKAPIPDPDPQHWCYHWFNADLDTDPDPAFFLIADPDPGYGSRVWWPNIEKIYSWKFNFYHLEQKLLFFLSLGLHKGRPSYRRSLQPSKENIQYLKPWKFWTFKFYFCVSFLPSWIRIRNLNADPDPTTQINADPDPKPWVLRSLYHVVKKSVWADIGAASTSSTNILVLGTS
jgi:hypothetical protein